MKKVYTIDGEKFSTLEEFYKHFGEVVLSGYTCPNLNAFNDVLRGGFTTPEDGFVIRWLHSEISRERLGYAETIKWLGRIIKSAHPSGHDKIRTSIKDAKEEHGPTLFDKIVEIILDHRPGGKQMTENVELELL